MKKPKQTNRSWLQRAALKVAMLCAGSLLVAGQATQAKQESELPGLGVQPDEVFFTGKTYSEELGGVVFKYRNYDPELNRWTAFDPSGFPDGVNNFVYSKNPLIEIDPTGLELLLTEQEALNILASQIQTWNNQGWNFAANVLSHFVGNTGAQYTGSANEANSIKDSNIYRSAAESHFNSIASGYMSQGNGTYNIGTAWDGNSMANKAFGARWKPADDGNLFNALGGAHFFYSGTLTVENGAWSVDVTMEQADWYTFMTPEGILAALLNAPPSGRAAWMLEKHYEYVPFWNYESWNDQFSE